MDLARRLSEQCADLRVMHRRLLIIRTDARRRRDLNAVRQTHRLIARCLRALRYAARVRADRATEEPDSPDSNFSNVPKTGREAPKPPALPETSRRRAVREHLRRR
ncbi:hypothetical protein [Brevundimonas sp. FT23042]|uniref:hypothetical protein n=1 Tax=Brevundimonas sp. FT23042 TaxID=3393749 RepID=UPI003B587E4D